MWVIVLLLVIGQVSALKDYKDEDFAFFPDLYHVDRFTPCVGAEGGIYCVAEAKLVSGTNTGLYEKMKNFSFSSIRHLDYTKIRYGYCITRRCKEFYTGDSDSALEVTLGACLNSTLQKDYGLLARLEHTSCHRYGEKTPLSWLDRAAIVLFVSLISLVLAATLYDLAATQKDSNGYLLCFSIPANWAKLTAPWPKDQATARLIGLNGIRAINSIYVMVVHTTLPLPASVANPIAMERSMETLGFRMIVNAQMIVQTFFFLSGMLLAYTTLVTNEKRPMTVKSLPKTIFLRWLRLSPVLLTVFLYVVTWFKFVPRGPLWQELVDTEARDCQQGWFNMVFLFNNYVDGFQCQLHHWSTAVDFHLHIVGLVLLLLPAGVHAAAAWTLVIIGAILPGLETYFRNLDGVLTNTKHVQSPRMFAKGSTFHYLYIPTHTNMPAYFMGMAFGLFLHKWMKMSVDTSKYKRYACFYWLMLPVLMGVTYCYSLLDMEKEGESNMRQRLAYAMLPKVVWAAAIAGIIFGTICRVDKAYRRVLEWPFWVPVTRLTYCTYNVHLVIIRSLYASDSQLTHFSDFHMSIKTIGIVVMAFILAVPLWFVVEAPSNNVVRKLFPEKKSILDDKSTTEKNE